MCKRAAGLAMKDTVTLLACLAVGLKLTNDAMRANAGSLPLYHRDVDGPVTHTGQAAARYVRVDAVFATEFAGPLVLQGAVTTCYCFALYTATSAVVVAAAYAFVMLKSAAMTAIALNHDPLRAVSKLVASKAGDTGRGTSFVDEAVRAVFQNTMASTGLLFKVAIAQAAAAATVLVAMAAFALTLKPRWAFVHKRRLYVDSRFLTQASTASTLSAFPFVCALLFSRTEMWARWKAAAWRFFQ